MSTTPTDAAVRILAILEDLLPEDADRALEAAAALCGWRLLSRPPVKSAAKSETITAGDWVIVGDDGNVRKATQNQAGAMMILSIDEDADGQ